VHRHSDMPQHGDGALYALRPADDRTAVSGSRRRSVKLPFVKTGDLQPRTVNLPQEHHQ
jgi:hypothetical protein